MCGYPWILDIDGVEWRWRDEEVDRFYWGGISGRVDALNELSLK